MVDVNEKKEKTNYPPCNDQDWQRHLPHHDNEAHPFFFINGPTKKQCIEAVNDADAVLQEKKAAR